MKNINSLFLLADGNKENEYELISPEKRVLPSSTIVSSQIDSDPNQLNRSRQLRETPPLSDLPINSMMEARAMKFVRNHILFKGRFFEFLEYTAEHVIAKCCICQQNKLGAGNSPSNLITHLKRCHPEANNRFESLKKNAEKKNKKSSKICDQLNSINNKGASVSKEDLEKAIIRFIIQDMQPFVRTESIAFQNLIAVCLGYSNSGDLPFNVMSERTVKRKISDLYDEHEKELVSIISQQKWFCLTADIWSCKNIDKQTLKRNSFVLSCQDFPSPHTHENITESFQMLYHKFSIKPKSVVATVTDNGSNFVCSFKVFGKTKEEFSKFMELIREACGEDESEDIPDDLDISKIVEVLKKLSNDESETNESDLQDEAIELFDVIRATGEENDNEMNNPECTNYIRHVVRNEELNAEDVIALSNRFSCNTHNLNLIGGVDSLAAHKNKKYSKMYEAVFEKLNLLWHASGKQHTSEIIIKYLGCNINKPNKTRWNWCYDRISEALRFDVMKLNLAMMSLEIRPLTENQRQFLNEYKVVLKPIAKALDNLQQGKAPYAIVLPTLYDTHQKLIQIKNENKLKHCKPLLMAVLNGFNRRLGYMLDTNDERSHPAVIATVAHPFFKLRWLKSEERTSNYIDDIKDTIVNAADQIFVEDWCNLADDSESNFAPVENKVTTGEMTQTCKLNKKYFHICRPHLKFN